MTTATTVDMVDVATTTVTTVDMVEVDLHMVTDLINILKLLRN
jgi:hypothetical protein